MVTEAVILCGGLGTRLRSLVSDRPKPMAQIGDKFFLDLLIENLQSQGIKRIILCTGYLSEYIETRASRWSQSTEIIISKEEQKLDTGGAIKNALKHLESDVFIALNGDSYCQFDLSKLVSHHFSKQALITITTSYQTDVTSFGSIEINENGMITDFLEKGHNGSGFVNSGIYVIDKKVFGNILETKFSLERDLFPALINDRMTAFVNNFSFIDIGTPESYKTAKTIFK
ncbi:hypothetical protein XM47_03460 [Catenovulum maritimum]|uniref:Nucleotidyl transferase domain-containing protein n=2 Tax=Catenovulum maritimum TaxID=1513271 RepID=A0A0J8GV74_9ALTE|nr:hypothetical protein XM47_03460 [Catenovulum maritimum]